ncbi:MAG: hypothetical protein JXJ20_09905 [Anaerolineae bacterium]|nr:hypothetical protein [Anaerolineae bacterium]
MMHGKYRVGVGLALVLLLLVTGGAVFAQDGGEWDDRADAITFDGINRSFWIHFPDGYDGSEAVPLVILLHGASMSGVSMMLTSDFNTPADEAGYIVVYPNAMQDGWDYLYPEEIPEGAEHIDDAGFLSALIDYMADPYGIDTNRVYVAGYSNGGRMALRARCDLSDKVAGVAVIAANLSFQMAEHCVDSEPTSLLLILGTQDSAFPWNGYVLVMDDGYILSVLSYTQAAGFLKMITGCAGSADIIDATAPTSPYVVQRSRYDRCDGGAVLELYALLDAAHDWPGQYHALLDGGETGSLNDAIWQFFEGQSLADRGD